MKMIHLKKCTITHVFLSFIFMFVINDVTAVDYSHRQDEIPKNVTQNDARTTRQILELTTKIKKLKKKYTLQEGTEHLLQFGAFLRTQIMDTFGYLVYDRYDDFSIAQIEALYRVYHETLERKYNIFDIVPSVLTNADIRPTHICRYINEYVYTCLKESSQLCMNIRKHNKRRLINLNYTPQIYQLAKIQQHFPDGFSLKIILHHLQNNSLKLTPSLQSGLLYNVQYDSFDDEVRTAERELIRFLMKTSKIPKHSILMTKGQIQNERTIGELLKTYLKNASVELKNPVNFHAQILAEHVIREVEAISENIEQLGIVYENNNINLRYLFDLILPSDIIDKDLNEAKEYLLRKTDKLQVISKYLRIEKYQQAGPDQLLMEILGQMKDIHFAVDIVSALHTHARFWHRSRAIENIDELLDLFLAYENLRNLKEYTDFMKVIDHIKNRLSDSKNVSIEFSCSHPRACLQIGLQIVMECAYVDEDTRNLIRNFFDKVTPRGSPAKEECSLMQTFSTKNETEGPDVTSQSNQPDMSKESRRGFYTTTKDLSSEEEEEEEEEDNNSTTFLDNSESSSGTTALLPTRTAKNIGSTEVPVDSQEIETEVPTELSFESTSISFPITEKVTITTEKLSTTTEKVITTTEEVLETTKETTMLASTPTEVSIIQDTTKNPMTIVSSTTECSDSQECYSECSGENCSREDCSTDNCKSENPCKGDGCKNKLTRAKNCSDQNCTTIECEGSECPSNECNGIDCSISKKNTTCDGENCSEEKEETTDCEGKDCPNKGKDGCKGSDCLKEEEIVCKGSDCPDNEEIKDCKGSSCLDEKEPLCTGPKCQKSDCKGKNCPENPEAEVPKNKTTVLCSNKDPHRQRKKERLKKMHKFDTNSTEKVDEQTEKDHIVYKKKHSERNDVTEKAKGGLETDLENMELKPIRDFKKLKERQKVTRSSQQVTSDDVGIRKKGRQIHDKNNSKKKVKNLDSMISDSNQDQNSGLSETNNNNFHSNNDRKKTKKVDSRKRNTLVKLKSNEDLLNNEELSKEKDELETRDSSKNEDAFKNYDSSENLELLNDESSSKNKDSLKNSYEKNQQKNSNRRSNYPTDSKDMRFLYQTQKSKVNTGKRSNFEDLLKEYDNERPENRMFQESSDEESLDEIERNRKIMFPRGQHTNFEDVFDNEDYYDGEDGLTESEKSWSHWYL